MTEEARQGTFRYVTAAGEQRTVNVLSMAAAAGLQSTGPHDYGRCSPGSPRRNYTRRSSRARRSERKS